MHPTLTCSRAILPNAELWIAGDSELQLEATRVSIDVRTMAVSTGSSVTLQYASVVLGQLHWAGCLRVQRVCLGRVWVRCSGPPVVLRISLL